ncbi:MAG: hypothetical protein IPF96_02215 [Rhodobacter sp.]|nr:hypothetical protein [Rhodobacter sp.]
MSGRFNIVAGFGFLAAFMLYGFVLIYLLAHAHGNLFALINIAVGLVLLRLKPSTSRNWISGLALAGMLMPLGILSEVLFGVPPLLVMAGGAAMVLAMGWLALAALRLDTAA